MRITKKIILRVWIVTIISWLTQQVYADNTSPDISWFWDNDMVRWYEVPWAGQGTFSDNNDDLLTIIKKVINWILGILSLIALILCLWWWFQMLTAAGDDNKVKTWTKILKQAAIWLVVIWLSWLLVSFIFRIINKFTVWS